VEPISADKPRENPAGFEGGVCLSAKGDGEALSHLAVEVAPSGSSCKLVLEMGGF